MKTGSVGIWKNEKRLRIYNEQKTYIYIQNKDVQKQCYTCKHTKRKKMWTNIPFRIKIICHRYTRYVANKPYLQY